GHDKARVLLALQVLVLGHDPPLPLPPTILRLLGPIAKLAKYPRRLAGGFPLLGRFPHLTPDNPSQPLVTRQSQHILHSVTFAPAHQLVPAETAIPAQDDFHFRPRRPDLLLSLDDNVPFCPR